MCDVNLRQAKTHTQIGPMRRTNEQRPLLARRPCTVSQVDDDDGSHEGNNGCNADEGSGGGGRQ